jgi:GLPGLI family protein
MKKQLFIFTILFVAFQTILSQNLEVIYHTDFTRNAANPRSMYGDQTVLNISSGCSEFYSVFKDKIDALTIKMQKEGASNDRILQERRKLSPGYIYFRIYKNLPKKGKLTFTDWLIHNDYGKYTEDLEKPLWKIEKASKEIIGNTCQKATAHFRGRIWTAWYTTNIPVQEGPWKLWGLPGLILEAYDSDSLYRFVAIGIKNTTERNISIREKQYINCSRGEYMKEKNRIEENLIAALTNSSTMKIVLTDSSGKKITPKSNKYINIEIDEK